MPEDLGDTKHVPRHKGPMSRISRLSLIMSTLDGGVDNSEGSEKASWRKRSMNMYNAVVSIASELR